MIRINRITCFILLSILLSSCRAMMVPVDDINLRHKDTKIQTGKFDLESGPSWGQYSESRNFVYVINAYSIHDSTIHTMQIDDMCFVNEKNGDTIPVKLVLYQGEVDNKYTKDTLRQQLPASIILTPDNYNHCTIEIIIFTDYRKMKLIRVKVSYRLKLDEENVAVDSVYLTRKYISIIGFRHISDIIFLPFAAPFALYEWIFSGL